ncbi:MAG TPA: cysteine--tRNA ligase [Gaiellaceae bacterium]|nr:cysteine--tRNA ligase [Gaiellaceae bacterium]
MRLFDTYTKSLVELPPPPGPVRMYFCGPTVYARAHVGNARPFVVGMWLRSWLRMRGYQATLVHNITDVNDKIYDAAPGASAALAERATAWYLEDTGDLGLGMPDALPKVTEHVPEIVRFVEELVRTGHAYPVDGDVYFRVASFPEYGRLSGQRPDQVAEQEPNPRKEDPRDFALWKANKEGEDTAWDSPWGRGRPGWHIECSVLAEELLGPSFEIHGGGLDLVFPHHENELAQSRALGHPFARIWAHNGMLRFTGEKMSKSVGNIATLRETLDEWGRETLLVFFLSGHWRKPIDFSPETMAQAAAQAETLRNVFRGPGEPGGDWEAFAAALDDDFSTPEALAVLHGWRDHDLLRRALAVFGLESLAAAEAPPDEVVELARRRHGARAEREWAEADRLREAIEAAGWEVRDAGDGFRLVRRRR